MDQSAEAGPRATAHADHAGCAGCSAMGDDFRLVGRGVGSDRVDHLLGEHDLGNPGRLAQLRQSG